MTDTQTTTTGHTSARGAQWRGNCLVPKS